MARTDEIELIAKRLKGIADALAGLQSGLDGADGSDGATGTSVLAGSGAPTSSLGNNGDVYIDTAASPPDLYGPKTAGEWGSAVPLGATIPTHQKAIILEAVGSSEDVSIFYTNVAITISAMYAVARGTSPDVDWTIRHDPVRSDTGNEVVTGGSTTTTQSGETISVFNDATIPAGSWVWLETTGATGTVDEFAVVLDYSAD